MMHSRKVCRSDHALSSCWHQAAAPTRSQHLVGAKVLLPPVLQADLQRQVEALREELAQARAELLRLGQGRSALEQAWLQRRRRERAARVIQRCYRRWQRGRVADARGRDAQVQT